MNKRIFGTVAAAVVALLVVGATTVKLLSPHSSKPAGNKSAAQKADGRPIPATELQASVDKATHYLQANLAQVEPYQRLLLDFLQRKFQLDSVFSGEVTPIVGYPEGIQATQYAAVERIAYPDNLVDTLPPLDTTTDSMVAYAVNCDRIPFPDGYENTLNQNLKEGSYGLTHVVFAFDFIRDNGCTIPASWAKIRHQALQGTLRYAGNANMSQDIHYEAIAFVLHDNLRTEVKPSWIRQIIHEQRRDGGWGGAANETVMQDHQTMLALWALLEYAHPDAEKEPLIQRPS
jgi:hypothetical protein